MGAAVKSSESQSSSQAAPARARAAGARSNAAAAARGIGAAGRPLDDQTRQRMESAFSTDFSSVRIFDDSQAHRSARELGARAYTLGQNVVFGANAYAPATGEGRRLLAHELAHTIQQEPSNSTAGATQMSTAEASQMSTPTGTTSPNSPIEAEADRAAMAVASGRRPTVQLRQVAPLVARACDADVTATVDDCVGIDGEDIADVTTAREELILFNPGCDDLRPGPDEPAKVVAAAQSIGPDDQIELHGFASEEGSAEFNANLSCARALAVQQMLVGLGFSAQNMTTFAHGATPGPREHRRSVAIVSHRALRVPSCSCPPGALVTYDADTLAQIRTLRGAIRRVAAQRGVPLVAIAGPIADEFNTRRGFRVIVDGAQDSILDALPEHSIDVDRYFDLHYKLLNALENDIGMANIKVRTALELVESGELTVPGSPASDAQVNRIIDFLLLEQGTIETTGAVIGRAQQLFGPHITDYPDELAEAVLVEYFKQGERYHTRFSDALALNPEHLVCPGDGGCNVMHNRDALLHALRMP